MSAPNVVLITGASQGLGLEAAIQLARTGVWHVLMGCRNVAKGEKARESAVSSEPSLASHLTVLAIDVASDDSIAAAVKKVHSEYKRLDLLINNAAAFSTADRNETKRQVFARLFDVNATSHALVTDAFLPLIKASTYGKKRIVMVTSSLGSLTQGSDPNHVYYATFNPIYRATKSALNMLAVYHANMLKADGIAVVLVCPGFCKTESTNYQGIRPPHEGGRNLVIAATEQGNAEITGKWIDHDGIVPW